MWKCKYCDSPEVERLDWVDLNSGDQLEEDLDEFYCRSCGNNVEVYYDDNLEEEETNEKPMGDITN